MGLISRVSSQTYRMSINEHPTVGEYTQDDALAAIKQSAQLVPDQLEKHLCTPNPTLTALRVRRAFDIFTAKQLSLRRTFIKHQVGHILDKNLSVNLVEKTRNSIPIQNVSISSSSEKKEYDYEPIPELPENTTSNKSKPFNSVQSFNHTTTTTQ